MHYKIIQTQCGNKRGDTIINKGVFTNRAQNSMKLLQGQAKRSRYSKLQPEVCTEARRLEAGKHLCPAEASPRPK